MKPTWLEIYKKDGEWKIANGRTGQVLRTEDTKMLAERAVKSFMGQGGKYNYVSAQFYQTDGNRGKRMVDRDAVKYWTKTAATAKR